jgi:hypothetical protein
VAVAGGGAVGASWPIVAAVARGGVGGGVNRDGGTVGARVGKAWPDVQAVANMVNSNIAMINQTAMLEKRRLTAEKGRVNSPPEMEKPEENRSVT